MESPVGLLFSDLPPDVILSVFACCDISRVVSMGQTSTYLHRLAFNKSVWLSLLNNLRRRCILDQTYTPNIETLSTEEMIGVVQRLITGPETWNPREPDCAAEVSREIILRPTIRTGPGALPWENVARLLPSGHYQGGIGTKIPATLGCWHVADNKLLWTHISAIEHAGICEFAAEESDDGRSLNILICVRSYPPLFTDRKNYVEIVRVNLETGNDTHLVVARAPDSSFDNPFGCSVIRGALAAVRGNGGLNFHMIINWRARSYFIPRGPTNTSSQIALIPGHILLRDASPERKGEIHVIANAVLGPYWVPATGMDDPMEFGVVSAEDIPKLSTIMDVEEQSFDDVYVHESPLQDDSYRIWVKGTNYAAKTRGVLSYQLTITDETPRWRRRSGSLKSGPLFHDVSYAGHSLQLHTIFSPTSSPRGAQVEMPSRGDMVDVAPYSGALTHSTRLEVVIQYYR
ncbi:hypothetical protein K438DRAFT_1963769 [Mycena galopus ATCC 62051]|nr:hypothetical protein K438DRAFT_1963769 [Mycena galopus ATCC 62051]